MKYSLEDLETIGTCNVHREDNLINSLDRGAYCWYVDFVTEAGDLEMMQLTAGRLSDLESGVKITVQETRKGTPSKLVYSGTSHPDIRFFTTQVDEGVSYAYSSQVLNGAGFSPLSAASPTVIATSGASATYTTATGNALSTGITNTIPEQQVIRLSNCDSATLVLGYLDKNTSFSASFTTEQATSAVNSLGFSEDSSITVQIIYQEYINASITFKEWRVQFLGSGDLDLMTIIEESDDLNCKATVIEFVKGAKNQFTIEPKNGAGDVVKDNAGTTGFAGTDHFLVETYNANNEWHKDQGLAKYNGVLYEKQTITVPSDKLSIPIYLSLEDYLQPHSTAKFNTTKPFSGHSTAAEVQNAIETLTNIRQIDVGRNVEENGDVTFTVQFTENLGFVPLLKQSNAEFVTIVELQRGVTEVQVITSGCDRAFQREEKILYIPITASEVYIQILDYPQNLTLTGVINATEIENIINTALIPENSISGTVGGDPVSVLCEKTSLIGQSQSFTCIFYSPVDDVGPVKVWYKDGVNPTLEEALVVEQVKGQTFCKGTFTIQHEGQYTKDLPYNCSAIQMKNELEALSSVSIVKVEKEDINVGFKWSVYYVGDVGNQRLMKPEAKKYEIQRIWTEGGDPTPLNGCILLSSGIDTVRVSHDATGIQMKNAIESMEDYGHVEVTTKVFEDNKREWTIIFYQDGDIENLGVISELTGSEAAVYIEEVEAGNAATLVGFSPSISIFEKVQGKPDYLATYTVESAGSYYLVVSKILSGGLQGKYYDNEFGAGVPSLLRIDATPNMDFSTGLITDTSSDYVYITWEGKIKVDKSEHYTFYVTADDKATVEIDHRVVIDATDECCTEVRGQINLVGGTYYEVKIIYVELVGTAYFNLKMSSQSVQKQNIPPEYLYHTEPIEGSPFLTTIESGAPDAAFSDFDLPELRAAAGDTVVFTVSTRDSSGNTNAANADDLSVLNLLSVNVESDNDITRRRKLQNGNANAGVTYKPIITYKGNGQYEIAFQPLKTGSFEVSIAIDGKPIQCGQAAANDEDACGVFNFDVESAPATAQHCEIESPAGQILDGLREAVALESSNLYIQAKDSTSNNKETGGDDFQVTFTNKNDPNEIYLGQVEDQKNGQYVVHYTIPTAGYYEVEAS
jgi:hypothetical protein